MCTSLSLSCTPIPVLKRFYGHILWDVGHTRTHKGTQIRPTKLGKCPSLNACSRTDCPFCRGVLVSLSIVPGFHNLFPAGKRANVRANCGSMSGHREGEKHVMCYCIQWSFRASLPVATVNEAQKDPVQRTVEDILQYMSSRMIQKVPKHVVQKQCRSPFLGLPTAEPA